MTVIGTPVYMAPEILASGKYSEKADVYRSVKRLHEGMQRAEECCSFGVVLLEIFTGNRPFSEEKYAKLNQAQVRSQAQRERSGLGVAFDVF